MYKILLIRDEVLDNIEGLHVNEKGITDFVIHNEKIEKSRIFTKKTVQNAPDGNERSIVRAELVYF